MESVFANDSTDDLKEMLEDTRKQKRKLEDEVESCGDCILDIVNELRDREMYRGQTVDN